jgi:predicted transcriptional regulator
MLRAIQEKGGRIKPTHLLYKSNLSHNRMNSYLEYLKKNELIGENTVKNKKVFQLTDKGFSFIENYKKVREFSDAFGI